MKTTIEERCSCGASVKVTSLWAEIVGEVLRTFRELHTGCRPPRTGSGA